MEIPMPAHIHYQAWRYRVEWNSMLDPCSIICRRSCLWNRLCRFTENDQVDQSISSASGYSRLVWQDPKSIYWKSGKNRIEKMAENRTVLDSLHGRYRNLTDLIYEHSGKQTSFMGDNVWLLVFSDLRSRDMLFMRRLDIVIYMAIGYVSFCFWGPRIMAKRKPFDLKWTMFAYNVVVALWSLWMFLEVSS